MARKPSDNLSDHDHPEDAGGDEDLWFLPGPDDEGDAPSLFGLPRVRPAVPGMVADWAGAEAAHAALLARVAGLLGALDERLLRGPKGWQHRLALLEAADLSWFCGDRVPADRLALWVALRLAGVQDDPVALARVGWAVRRLTGGPGPEGDLAGFLGRHDLPAPQDDPAAPAEDEPLADRAAGWTEAMRGAEALHPISRACLGYHHWALAGFGDRLEAAVTAARVAASAGSGAMFAPLAMGGPAPLRATGDPAARLGAWLWGMEGAILAARRHLDRIEGWEQRAQGVMAPLSGRTPPALRQVLSEWPLVSAPLAEAVTGASRAAVQRNLAWMEGHGLIHEVTGQGRFRMWRAAI